MPGSREAERAERYRPDRAETVGSRCAGGVVSNEPESLLGIPRSQRLLHGRLLRDCDVPHQGNGWFTLLGAIHVVAVGNTEIVIKPMADWLVPGKMPQMPLADARRGVTSSLEGGSQGQLTVGDPAG